MRILYKTENGALAGLEVSECWYDEEDKALYLIDVDSDTFKANMTKSESDYLVRDMVIKGYCDLTKYDLDCVDDSDDDV